MAGQLKRRARPICMKGIGSGHRLRVFSTTQPRVTFKRAANSSAVKISEGWITLHHRSKSGKAGALELPVCLVDVEASLPTVRCAGVLGGPTPGLS